MQQNNALGMRLTYFSYENENLLEHVNYMHNSQGEGRLGGFEHLPPPSPPFTYILKSKKY